jgi:glycogen synthase
MFGWEFPPHITGGLGTACYGLTRGLIQHGVDVTFVVPKAYGDESQEGFRLVNASDVDVNYQEIRFVEQMKKMRVMEIGSNLVPYLDPEEFETVAGTEIRSSVPEVTDHVTRKYQFSGKYGINLMEEVARYAMVAGAIAMEEDFDVIHAHDWLTYAAGISAKNVSGKPLVIHVHATEFDRSGENVNQPVYEIERSGMVAADLIITVSNLTRQIVIDRYGISPDKVITVHNAVEPVDKTGYTGIKKNVDEKVVTFLGRVTFQKGPDYFIEAAYKVLQKDPNVRFVMAGSGDLLNRMIRRVAKLHIATKFHFTGFLAGADVDKMFVLSDVYVMPSVSEPFGISPLEAMRSNVPVVISKQSGVAEVLKHAMKVDFWDIDGLADAIYALLHYEGIRKMFYRYGKDEVDSLKWDNAAVKVLEVYKKAIGNE